MTSFSSGNTAAVTVKRHVHVRGSSSSVLENPYPPFALHVPVPSTTPLTKRHRSKSPRLYILLKRLPLGEGFTPDAEMFDHSGRPPGRPRCLLSATLPRTHFLWCPRCGHWCPNPMTFFLLPLLVRIRCCLGQAASIPFSP